MNYILLICSDDKVWASLSQDEMQKMYAEHEAYGKALTEAGVLRGGAELKPASTATTLRSTNGKVVTVDGPFAETKEQLGGFYLIDVDNLEQALDWAGKMPGLTRTSMSVEVRPLGAGAGS
jgi:hypothetical protein